MPRIGGRLEPGSVVERRALDRLARHDHGSGSSGYAPGASGNLSGASGNSSRESFLIVLDRRGREAALARSRRAAPCPSGSSSIIPPCLAVRVAQPRAAANALPARPLDGQHLAGVGIDDHAAAELVDSRSRRRRTAREAVTVAGSGRPARRAPRPARTMRWRRPTKIRPARPKGRFLRETFPRTLSDRYPLRLAPRAT